MTNSRTKGKAGELEVCHLLADNLGVKAHRNLTQTRDSGCDIILPPFNLEIKRRQSLKCVYDWYEQAERSCRDNDQRPVVIFRADRKRWMAIISLEEFCILAREEIAADIDSDKASNEQEREEQ